MQAGEDTGKLCSKSVALKFWQRRSIHLSLSLSIAVTAGACGPTDRIGIPDSLNSRYTDEQPALSGNGRFLALVSNRNGTSNILLYDLQQQQMIPLPRLKQRETIAQSPSLSYTGRYIVYIASDRGKPTVVLYDRSTQQVQALTQWYLGWVRHPSISPDGRYVVFETGSRGQWDIEILDRGPNIELDIPDGTPVGNFEF